MSLFKKFLSFFFICFFSLFLTVLSVKVKAETKDESVDFTDQSYTNQQAISTYEGANFVITFDKGTNSNAPKYYTSGTAIRAYGGNTFTISSENNITKIVITFGSSDGTNAITTDVDTYNNGTWSGSSKSVTFTIGGTSGNRRLSSITVTYEVTAAGTYDITFDANGGTGSDPEKINVVQGGNSTALPTPSYTKEGYAFDSWNTAADGSGTSYSVGDTINNVTENIKLFAQWTFDSANYYRVTFNANGGTGENIIQAIKKNVKTQLVVNTFTNGALGFKGWNTESDGSGTAYSDTDFLTHNSDITLYAKWGYYSIAEVLADANKNKEYAIQGEIISIWKAKNAYIQDASGGILLYDSQITIDQNCPFKVGNTVSLIGTYATYSSDKELQNLKEINVESDDSIINTAPLSSLDDVEAGNKYKYVELEQLQISSISNTTVNLVGLDFSLYYDSSVKPSGIENLEVNNYIDIKGVINIYSGNVRVTIFEISLSEQYTVSFNTDDGDLVESQQVLKGNKATKPLTDPKKTNFVFDGWYQDIDKTIEFDFNSAINEDTTIYAKWRAASNAEKFTSLNVNSRLSVNYTKTNNPLTNLNTDFKVASLPTGWTGTLDGQYNGSNYQSFRNNNRSVTSPKFGAQSIVEITMDVYLNNSNSNKSSILKFDALDNNGNVVATQQSENINEWATGAANHKDLDIILESGTDIVQIRVTFLKDGGGNVAFSKIDIEFGEPIDNYEYALETTQEGIADVALQFGVRVNSELYNSLLDESAEFGILYAKSGTSFADYDGSNDNIRKIVSSPVIDNGDYQFGVSINEIPLDKLDYEISAAAYVKVGEDYYLTSVRTESVKSVAALHANDTTNTPAQHLGMLQWLAK